VVAVPGPATEPGCAAELTEFHAGGPAWWSLGFEAAGPAGLLRSALQPTAALMFAQAPPGEVHLTMSCCQSCAQWLSRHREPGMTQAEGQS
jgi:hypothetical protein